MIWRIPNIVILSSLGFQNLSALEQLSIGYCPKLASLPEKGLPPSLLHLYIKDCPLLKQHCKKGGREWSKIANVPCVEIDRRNHPTSKVAESIKNLLRPMKFIGSPMAKKKSWFNILKRFFIRETNSKQETDRRRKWIFGGLKIKRLSLLTAPSSLNERNLDEAEEELIKHALAVAHATKAAAEAAVTTALVASEIVQFTSTPQYNHQCVNDVEEFSVIRVQGEAPQSNYQCVREIHEFAVTRIQSAFRGLPCEFKEEQLLERRRKWIFGGLKIKRLFSLTAPSSLNERSLGEAEEELIKHALAVAHAATAAAEQLLQLL
ncbi:hypothetical protein CMV_020052 [Castanea mollissima]|uniref:Uncharacterized protein n=1 Tax=Castanea mollissima TaxID=60419 RepID=A0A8J4QRA3_9ROSI|nr:hypothetical protein CMV_020052 [Castanea mollissima]